MKIKLMLQKKLFIILFIGIICSCADKLDKNYEEPIDEGWQEVSLFLFDPAFSSNTILLNSCVKEGNIRTYEIIELVRKENIIPYIKTKSENNVNREWIRYGKVCGMTSAVKFQKKMKEIYGAKCYEMKADQADDEGCRMMYHRSC